MGQPKKLIEVAMPIKEISAESMRDKSIRHGHISTLHLWWARRPLPVCRAVIFASLLPDPLDENCPHAFRDAVEILLGKSNNVGDPYKPYDDIPYTAALDKMDDNLRNRLLMFIGKFSDKYIQNVRQGKNTDAKYQLSDASLIKWDNKNSEEIINKARKLIWVAYNSPNGHDANTLLGEFDNCFKAIKDAETSLYSISDRHIEVENVKNKKVILQSALNSFLDKMPKVFDPFAGGGAIPLEAARLGCRSYGNDINPVAHIIQKGGLEFPQKFGKPITYSNSEFLKIYGKNTFNKIDNANKIISNGEVVAVTISNRLLFDVDFYAKKLINDLNEVINKVYPNNKNVLGYLWARTAKCKNPTCGIMIPLLRDLNAVKKDSHVYGYFFKKNLNELDIKIKRTPNADSGFVHRGNLVCPVCKNITDVNEIKNQFKNGVAGERMLAVIVDGQNHKEYRTPEPEEIINFESIKLEHNYPNEKMQRNSAGGDTFTWGIDSYDNLFNKRQLYILSVISDYINKSYKELKEIHDEEYAKAISVYLTFGLDRLADYYSKFCAWSSSREEIKHVFGRQAIPMIMDYAEVFPFSGKMGSFQNHIEWILRYIESESPNQFSSECINAASGDIYQFDKNSIDASVTDPPYYDAIAYADISDFFYVWMKRTIYNCYPYNFALPTTPKSEECTALKHHHNNSYEEAKEHFENKLTNIFSVINLQLKPDSALVIMFAHQSTEAWTTLCKSVLNSNHNIFSSWAFDSEYTVTGLKSDKSYLTSSVTVSCRPSIGEGIGNYRDVKKAVESTVLNEVHELYRLGFRGADLLTACFGQAVSVFGQFERVEKADGSEVTVAELLEMAKESAFNALLKGFDGDDFTKFYIGWLQLYGFTESDFDDAAKFSRVGLTINVSELFTHNLFIKNGNKQELAGYKDRLSLNRKIGESSQSFIIDNVHKAMTLFEGVNRRVLLEYISKVAVSPDSSFWRVITSLCEVLPQGSDDYKQAIGLLLNKESLIRESKNIQQSTGEQGQLF